jgi:molybdopterin-containing oxidoreductase family membrane subunit
MLDLALDGGRRYWAWLAALAAVVVVGAAAYATQLADGLGVTGLSRDVSWGLYIAQFTFMVGVAASAVTVVLPYALHDFEQFGRITILGEMTAIASVITCMLFIFVDMGQPTRVLNVLLHPTPHSVMFWDMTVLAGYLFLNVLISRVSLGAERKGLHPPAWIRPVVILSIPWAVGIHTVTAFLYAGLASRPFWLTAILAPRFLASAFASGPALLILVSLVVRRVAGYDVGDFVRQKLGILVTYAMTINVFFLAMEIFTATYSGIPEHVEHLEFLFFGLPGNRSLVPLMWTCEALAAGALFILYGPSRRANEKLLAVACAAVFASVWIEKGLGMVLAGFVPTPLGKVATYAPTTPEILIALGVYAVGLLVATVLYKIATSVRRELDDASSPVTLRGAAKAPGRGAVAPAES